MNKILYGSKDWVFFLHDILENPSKLKPEGTRKISWNKDEIKTKIEDLLKSGKASRSRLWLRLGTDTIHYHIEEHPFDIHTISGTFGKLHIYMEQDLRKKTGLTEAQIEKVLSMITGVQIDSKNIKITGDNDLDNIYIIEFPPKDKQ